MKSSIAPLWVIAVVIVAALIHDSWKIGTLQGRLNVVESVEPARKAELSNAEVAQFRLWLLDHEKRMQRLETEATPTHAEFVPQIQLVPIKD